MLDDLLPRSPTLLDPPVASEQWFNSNVSHCTWNYMYMLAIVFHVLHFTERHVNCSQWIVYAKRSSIKVTYLA